MLPKKFKNKYNSSPTGNRENNTCFGLFIRMKASFGKCLAKQVKMSEVTFGHKVVCVALLLYNI